MEDQICQKNAFSSISFSAKHASIDINLKSRFFKDEFQTL